MIQQEIHHEHTWAERFIWWCVHSFGALPILTCIFIGAIVLSIIIFRKFIQERFGDFIEWADVYVNKKEE